jgi:release factor glutamine methyltransferase
VKRPSNPAPTLAEAIARAAGELAPLLGDEARREAETLVLTCLRLPRSVLITDPARPLDAAEAARLAEWTTRRADGEPLAYLTGEREFWSLPFSVSPAVLVPRPETELLVECALRAGDLWSPSGRSADPMHPALDALDLGTGSGAVALSLAAARPSWRITAVDRSPAALAMARANAMRLALDGVVFLEGDWFGPVGERRYALVASNPPYVAADDAVLQGDSLRHEPRAALTPGPDALAALHTIIDAAAAHLLPGGSLLLEHGASQGEAVRARLAARGYADIVSHRDPAGHERVTEARLPPDPSPTR